MVDDFLAKKRRSTGEASGWGRHGIFLGEGREIKGNLGPVLVLQGVQRQSRMGGELYDGEGEGSERIGGGMRDMNLGNVHAP